MKDAFKTDCEIGRTENLFKIGIIPIEKLNPMMFVLSETVTVLQRSFNHKTASFSPFIKLLQFGDKLICGSFTVIMRFLDRKNYLRKIFI